jgi:hypothetical protein
MKALVYHGPKKVSVDTVPGAKIEKITDVVIKLTTTNICNAGESVSGSCHARHHRRLAPWAASGN